MFKPAEASQPEVAWRTDLGSMIVSDSLVSMAELEPSCTQLALFSPPFEIGAFQSGVEYSEWLARIFAVLEALVKPEGHVVFEFGNCWEEGAPLRSTHMFDVLHIIFSRTRWRLQQEFFWYNPYLLQTPSRFVDARLRKRASITNLFWLSRQPAAADISLIDTPDRALSNSSSDDLVSFRDCALDRRYRKRCRELGHRPFGDRFPITLATSFVRALSAPGDLILDPFAGCGTSGAAAEYLGRRWLCIERCRNTAVMCESWFDRGARGGPAPA
jgi:hypothetical protein